MAVLTIVVAQAWIHNPIEVAAEETAVSWKNKVQALDNEISIEDSIEAAKSLFEENCSACHEIEDGKISEMSRVLARTDGQIFRTIADGNPGTDMEGYRGDMKEADMWKLVGYIRSITGESAKSEWKPYLPGDPEEGQFIYEQQCAQCHVVRGEGTGNGPELSHIGSTRSPQDLVQSILYPSDEIPEEFRSVIYKMKEGQIMRGIPVMETEGEVTIAREDGSRISLKESEIAEQFAQTTSLMPDNFAEILTVLEFHDLLAYLVSLK